MKISNIKYQISKTQTKNLKTYEPKNLKIYSLVFRFFGFSVCIFYFLFFIFYFSLAWASPGLYLYSPQDKLITLKKEIMLSGVGEGLRALKVNGQSLSVSKEGKFSCGLVLHPGKNLVEIRAQDKKGKSYHKELRILKLENYPDLEGHWARQKVIYLTTLGFIEGYPDGNFYPSQPITRGELASWLARAKKLPLPHLTQDPFLDLPKEHWRAPAITATTKKGYMPGLTSEYFGIDEPITRAKAAYVATKAEGAEILWRAKEVLFQDVSKQESIAPPIHAAKKEGLVVGVSEKEPIFEPNRDLTRAEAAILLSRFAGTEKSVRSLLDFKQGFSKNVYARLDIAPEIKEFTIDPGVIYVNAEYTIKLRAKIESRRGFYPIASVKVDLSSIGGLPDAKMLDDGTFGDERSGDGIFSLNLKIKIPETGEKILKVLAADTLGWESEKKASLWAVK